MEFYIDYSAELELDVKRQIEFIRDEFTYLFGNKEVFSEQDRVMAHDLLRHLSRIINTPVCLDYLTQT